MNSFPLPLRIAAVAALVASPVNLAAAGTFGLTAALGAIIVADYSQRYRGLRVPRRQVAPAVAPRAVFRAPPLRCEPNRLAA